MRLPIRWKLFLSLVGPALLLAGMAMAFTAGWLRDVARVELRDELLARTSDQSARLDDRLRDIERLAARTADTLVGEGLLTQIELYELLRRSLVLDESLAGAGVVYKPFRFSPTKAAFAPYVIRVDGEPFEVDSEETASKLLRSTSIAELFGTGEPLWTELTATHTAERVTPLAVYTAPFGADAGNIDGAVIFELPLARLISETATRSRLSGDTVVASRDGRVLYSSVAKIPVNARLTELGRAPSGPNLAQLLPILESTRDGVYDMVGLEDKRDHWVFATTVSATGWTLLRFVLVERAVAFSASQLQRATIVSVILIALLVLLSFVVASYFTRPMTKLAGAAAELGSGDFSVRVSGIDRNDELGDLAASFNAMVSELGSRVEELTRATAQREAVEGELRGARRIQSSLLPNTFPPFPERVELELFGVNAPAAHVGGDFFDFFFRSEHELVLVIGDVSGKGIAAAMLMAVSRTIIHNLAMQRMQPAQILREANRLMVADSTGSMFVTLFVAIYRTDNGVLTYANGAHLAPLLVTQSCEVTHIAAPTGTLVGIFEDSEFLQGDEQIGVGDLLVLYTDGVTEARSLGGDFFGDAPLKRLLGAYADAPPRFLCDLVVREVNSHQEGERTDDLTLLMLRRLC